MASINRKKSGKRVTYQIQFQNNDGDRKTISLGGFPRRDVEAIRVKIEKLLVAQMTGCPIDGETARWVANLGTKLRNKLAKHGLVDNQQTTTLGDLVRRYQANHSGHKASTQATDNTTFKSLIEFFGDSRSLQSITPGDAASWRRSIKGAENTIRKRTGIAKKLFNDAKAHRLIESSPFDNLVSTMVENRDRMFFVTREDSQKVLDACPNNQWRLIFALARFGGLRCPSELTRLTWDDVLWDENKLVVSSPKTEHLVNHKARVVPIFPELRPYLEQAYDEAGEGAKRVFNNIGGATNLRTHMQRIIKKAGVEPWPKLFQNLRSTRQTELANEFPSHVVCSWIGNSKDVAAKHYLQVTDEHFSKAVASENLLHNLLQKVTEESCKERQQDQQTLENKGKRFITRPPVLGEVGDTGFEPVTSAV